MSLFKPNWWHMFEIKISNALENDSFIALSISIKEKGIRKAHEIQWWYIKQVKKSIVEKSLAWDKRQNGEMNIYTHMCLYIFVYLCIYIYIHLNIYTQIQLVKLPYTPISIQYWGLPDLSFQGQDQDDLKDQELIQFNMPEAGQRGLEDPLRSSY